MLPLGRMLDVVRIICVMHSCCTSLHLTSCTHRLLLAGAAGVLPLGRLLDVSQVICVVLQTWGTQALGWMAASLGLMPDPVVSQSDKQQLLGA